MSSSSLDENKKKNISSKKQVSLSGTSGNILSNPNFKVIQLNTEKKKKLIHHIQNKYMAFKAPIPKSNEIKLTTNTFSPEEIRYLLTAYYQKIVAIVQDNVIKTIVLAIIKKFETEFYTSVIDRVEIVPDINKLFYEDQGTVKIKRIIEGNLEIIGGLIKEIEVFHKL
jgi:hypothetical protein